MDGHISGAALPRKKLGLWTPWGLQRVADCDRPRRAARRDEDKERDGPATRQAEPAVVR